MDNSKKLFEGLLKADGLDPAGATESERTAFGEMLDEQSRPKQSKPGSRPDIWRIIMKSKITKFAAAAAMMAIAVLIGISFLNNGTSAWANVIQAFNEVKDVHISATMTGSYKTEEATQQFQWYLRKPDHIYEDSHNIIIIDNGTDRLTIDKKSRTAQFSDSIVDYNPIETHEMFESINLFRGQGRKNVEFAKLDNESDETTLVFRIHYKEVSPSELKGKAWVDALTMLPLKIQVATTEKTKDMGLVSYEMVFNYEPIPDKAFAMDIPEGFTELPRKQRGVLSGKVIDESGQGVNGAVVYAVSLWGRFAEKGRTNKEGFFSFVLPPEAANKLVCIPLFMRAFSEDNPDSVAWTTINNSASDRDIGAEIPGQLGKIEFEGNWLKNATDIVIKMEPAGSISGKIIKTDGNTIPNASVRLICSPQVKWRNASISLQISKLGGIGKRGELIVQTDEHGHFEFRNIPRFGHNSSFTLIASSKGYVKANSRFKAETPLNHKEIDITLLEAGLTIRGKLIDNYGEPLSARDIYAGVTIDGSGASAGATTDKKGEFTIEGAPISQNLTVSANLTHKNNVSPFDKEKYNSYVYYPNVVVGIDYEQGKNEYEVEMIAIRPEFVLNVEVKNTSGEILKYFPVEIRGNPGQMSTQWKVDKKFTRRTDENGRCTFTDVPKVDGLKLVLHGGNHVWHEKLSENEKIFADENEKKYFWSEVPIEIRVDQKEYNITAVALTSDEYNNQKGSHK